jgi:nuclear pore complex protein Nup98-Nup96
MSSIFESYLLIVFGQPPTTQQTQQQPTGGGLFGGFGLGQNQSNQQQQQGAGTTGLGGGLFGNKPSGGLFGGAFGANNTTNAAATNPLGGLGGTTQPTLGLNTGGGLFGQNNNASNLGGGLFGKPGGLFGTSNTAAPGAGLGAFGAAANNQSTLAGNIGNNLFGAFNQSTVNNTTPTTNNLLTSTTQQPGLTAAVDQPINADLPIFKLLPPGPQSILISPPKKKTNFFQSITNNPATARHMTPLAQSQLRGFGSQPKPMFSTVLPKPGNPSLMKIPGRPFHPSLNALSESRTKSDVEALRGSTPARQSVKKLILDRPAGPSELSSIIQKATPGKARPIFDGHLEAKVHDQDNEKLKGMITNANLQRLTAPPVRLPTLQTAARPASPIKAPLTVATDKIREVNVASLEKGEYWTKPSIAELSKMPFPDLQNLKHFTCGRVGYGEVKFLQPVDLTTCHSIHNITGKIITFEDRECTVYPVESEKPTRGEGLNVPAEIKLYGCWPVDKATRDPIRDEKHPKFAAHLRKLKTIPETHFISYEPGKGEWVFEVQHFSRYGLNDDDDDDEAMDVTPAAPPPVPVEGTSLVMIQEDDSSDDESTAETVTPHEDDSSSAMIVVPHGHPFQEEPKEEESDHIPWAARIGMEPDRMKQMQTSFFSTQTSAPLRAIPRRKAIGSTLPRTGSPTHLGKHPREAAVAEEHKRSPSIEVNHSCF